MSRGPSSLRRRILWLGTGTAALVIVLAAVPIAVLLRSAAYDDATREATFAAQGVGDYLSTGRYDDGQLASYLERQDDRGEARVSVVMPDGDVLGAPLPRDLREDRPGRPEGYEDGDGDGDNRLGRVSPARTTSVSDGRVVEVHAQVDQGVAEVYAFVGSGAVDETVRDRYLLVLGAALALLGIAAAAAELTTRRLVRPLQRTAETAGRLSAGDLAARAPVDGPTEVARVASELNALADRIDELLTAERETVADLSHRMRTPLTAMRLTVESLPPGQRTDELEAQVADLERTLTSVIRAARRPGREGVHPHCDAVAVARDRVAFWTPLAEDQGRQVGLVVPDGSVPVRSDADDLAVSLDALIENVVAHTPETTGFEVVVARGDGVVTVSVVDDGPGIPDGAAVRGRSDRGSSGLGLDIVRSHAEGAGGRLAVLREDGRTVVRLTLLAAQGPHTST
ncbi:MAG: HAMP domain-containing sensor histidine kinase [Aeromicrobium erythreum]